MNPLCRSALATLTLSLTLAICLPSYAQQKDATMQCQEPFNQEIERLHSDTVENLCDITRDKKAVLVVNTASHCGFTKQFGGLEKLYQKYKDQGLVILGFPSNSFWQEEKTEEGTANVCFKNFGVSFPMFTHVNVKGKKAHPLFAYLASNSKKPSWNFNKYLVTESGIQHFGSRIKPLDSKLEEAIASSVSD